MKRITEVSQIDTSTEEGTMLMASLAILTTEFLPSSTPQEVLEKIKALREKMEFAAEPKPIDLELRPCLKEFSRDMEEVLQENEHKGGWEKIPMFKLLEKLDDRLADVNDSCTHNEDMIRKDCVDLANYAMMIYDKAKK